MSNIEKTSLYEKHVESKAKMVEFANYLMPINYNKGIQYECNSVRKDIGLFDVSHMGQIIVKGNRSEEFLQYVTSNDISKLSSGKIQYSYMPNEKGGVVDDLLVSLKNVKQISGQLFLSFFSTLHNYLFFHRADLRKFYKVNL